MSIGRGGEHLRSVAVAVCLLAAPGALAGAAPPPAKAASSRPNIVVILVDTLRADKLSFYGHHRETAPFLASLAGEAVIFDRALSTSSKTSPAVASLFTSLYPDHHGVLLGRWLPKRLSQLQSTEVTLDRIPAAVDTLAEILKGAGYSTWGVADNYNVCEEMGFAQGFDRFVSESDFDRGSDYVNGVLKGWSRKIRRSEPYFLYVHYLEPHAPYHKQDLWYTADQADVKTTYFNGAPLDPALGRRRADFVWRYNSEIGRVDEGIRQLFEHFGWGKETLVVFLSDHGEEFWDHEGMGHGKTLFDEVVHIPLFFRGPGLEARRVPTPVSIVDVLPTLAEVAGVSLEAPRHGRSLLPELKGKRSDGGSERVLFAQVEGYPTESYVARGETKWHVSHFVVRAAMQGRWKLILDTRAAERVFDVAADPGEVTNLRTREGRLATELSARLDKYLAQAKAYDPENFTAILSKEEIEKLRSLGYVE